MAHDDHDDFGFALKTPNQIELGAISKRSRNRVNVDDVDLEVGPTGTGSGGMKLGDITPMQASKLEDIENS